MANVHNQTGTGKNMIPRNAWWMYREAGPLMARAVSPRVTMGEAPFCIANGDGENDPKVGIQNGRWSQEAQPSGLYMLQLEELGKDGWELVAVEPSQVYVQGTAVQRNNRVYHLKRPL
jgi:hypothetical protein